MKPWQNPVKIPAQDRWWTAAAAGSIGQSRLFETTNQIYNGHNGGTINGDTNKMIINDDYHYNNL